VGGESRRFGSDKANALFGGRTLLDHHLQLLHQVGCAAAVYVGGQPRGGVALDAAHVPDGTPGQGPLAGLVALLQHAQQASPNIEWSAVLMVACDIPLLSPGTARRVLDGLNVADVAVAAGDRDHWSCLAVRVSQYHTLVDVFRRGERALFAAVNQCSLNRVPVDEREFLNTNDPALLREAARLVTNSGELGQ